ncbi:MAG TPA: CoA pyrophosphatase [Bryobacteraceae bacterium]|jgi:8-oxo-dGTP pyrophosphatase MutT (NUDIX family)|nr:CoA pyrophosphatase [Bryobacteraceae bacterium]
MAQAQAAVAIVHARGAEESVLLIRRSERESDPWSGHWSFPGGRCEPGDEDLAHTALRELEEECGIHLNREHLEAALPHLSAGRRMRHIITVAPFLFRADSELPTVVDAEEVAEAVWVPLSLLRDPARHRLSSVPRLPPEMAFPAIELNGVPLWGFTYRVITDWLRLHGDPLSRERAGFEAAHLLLEFLLELGLKIQYDWEARDGRKVATVIGTIPVDTVLDHFAFPETQIPAVHALEVRPELIRVVGLDLEEYLIEATISTKS